MATGGSFCTAMCNAGTGVCQGPVSFSHFSIGFTFQSATKTERSTHGSHARNLEDWGADALAFEASDSRSFSAPAGRHTARSATKATIEAIAATISTSHGP